MIDRVRAIARALPAVLLLGMAGAAVAAGQPALANPASPAPIASPQPSSAPSAQAPAPSSAPQVNSAHLRIDHLINTIQDIRRRNFTSNLFQPVPGVYSFETWAKLPQYLPLAASRVGGVIADWWANVRDRQEVAHIALEAVLLCL